MSLSSCCTFCKDKIVVKSVYVAPDFSGCSKYDRAVYSYAAFDKALLQKSRLSPYNVAVLVNNLAMQEKELDVLRDIYVCYFKAIVLFNETYYGDKKDE